MASLLKLEGGFFYRKILLEGGRAKKERMGEEYKKNYLRLLFAVNF